MLRRDDFRIFPLPYTSIQTGALLLPNLKYFLKLKIKRKKNISDSLIRLHIDKLPLFSDLIVGHFTFWVGKVRIAWLN